MRWRRKKNIRHSLSGVANSNSVIRKGNAVKNDILDIFGKEHPEVDIRDFNFILAKQNKKIGESINDDHLKQLMQLQRVHRLHNDSCTAAALIEAGLHSAHHIAKHPEDVFVSRYQDTLPLDEQEMRQLHRRSMAVKQKTRMLAVTLKSTAGSAFYRSSKMNSQADNIQDYIKTIPNYQDFFGSLDYCSCDHDQSLFGPAAYLTDMLRIVYAYIDSIDINPNIPADWHFKTRRPDILQIPLSAEMTTNLVPFIQIVIQVLEQYVAALYNIEEGYSVIFADPNLPASHRGGSVTVPGFEVVLDKQCRVIRAHFSR